MRMVHPLRLILLASASLAFARPQAVAAQRPELAALDAYVAKAVKDSGIPGLAVAIVKDDSVVFANAFDRYAGIYADSLNGIAQVTVERGVLRVAWGKGFNGPLEHWHTTPSSQSGTIAAPPRLS